MRIRKECVLEDRPCTECGECDRCDLDPEKVCDNCLRCVKDEAADYRAIHIDGVLAPEEALDAEAGEGDTDGEPGKA